MGERKVRADLLLIERGLVATREKAKALIMAGVVKSAGKRVEKPGVLLPANTELTIDQPFPFVSRGGLKLAPALEAFGLEVKDKVGLDIGCSTGGFTDCLLQRGAKKVYAVDVSINQLDPKLRSDTRVYCIEKNARYLSSADLDESPQIVTMDVSFISVLKILPALDSLMREGELVVLLKPQFEASQRQVGKKGVIRSPYQQAEIILQVLERAQEMGFIPQALFACPVQGQKGNREFFVLWRKKGKSLTKKELATLVSEVVYGQKG